ncbi:MAG: zinc ribbon domain-containing protein [Clostridia bacterium]|nr:zinc ribbon domain-containing protein [Clostridia bacterium]
MDIKEKVAYIKGLAEGFKIDENDTNGKLLAAIIDVLGDIAEDIEDLTENAEYLENYVEELDEDLGMVEEDLYCGEDDEDEEDEEDFDEEFDEEEEDDEEIVVVTCPSCGDGVYLDDTMDFDEIKCPSCGATFSCACGADCENCEGCGE